MIESSRSIPTGAVGYALAAQPADWDAPKQPPSRTLASVLRSARDSSAAIDLLNARLQRFAEMLDQMPFKVETYVESEDRTGAYFTRSRGSEWRLYYSFGSEVELQLRPWFECSIAEKTTVARLLPGLFDKFASQVEEHGRALSVAHQALDQLDTRVGDEHLERGKTDAPQTRGPGTVRPQSAVRLPLNEFI